MKKLLIDKKGSEKVFSIWWFLVLTIVGVGIVAGVYVFYSADVDTKELEAEILSNKILDCIVEQGYLVEEFFEKGYDIYSACGLNEEVIDSGDFHFNISVFDTNNQLLREDIIEGTPSFGETCKINKGKKKVIEPFGCLEKNEIVLYFKDGVNEKATIKILTASSQKGRKIPLEFKNG